MPWCEVCGRPYPDYGDGYAGLCAGCADETQELLDANPALSEAAARRYLQDMREDS